MSTFSVINADMTCVTPRVGHTYIRTHRVTKGGNFKSCSMQLKKYSVVRQAGLAKPGRPGPGYL